jgi:hypothetical protein
MTIFHHTNGTCAITNTEQQQSSQQLLTFRHERGPSLLLVTQTYRSIFEETTENMLEHFGFHMKSCIPSYRVIYEEDDKMLVFHHLRMTYIQ